MSGNFFNPADWYWSVAGSATQVYSSAANTYVALNSPAYVTWQKNNPQGPTPILNEAELWDVLRQRGIVHDDWLFDGGAFARPTATTYSKAQLKAYAAMKRYNVETGGITVAGVSVATDRVSQALINGAFNMAAQNPGFKTKWKAGNTFAPLDAASVMAVATAVGTHVSDCFSAEAAICAAIDAGTTTTLAQIDSVLGAVQ